MPSATAPMRSRRPRTSPASSLCAAEPSAGRDADQAAAHRVELDQHPLHLVVEAQQLRRPCAAARAAGARSASASSRLAGSSSTWRQARGDALGRRVGQRLVERLGADRRRLHRAHEAVDLGADLLVGQIGAGDRVADALLALARVEHVVADRRRQPGEVELRRRLAPSSCLRRPRSRPSTLSASSSSRNVRVQAIAYTTSATSSDTSTGPPTSVPAPIVATSIATLNGLVAALAASAPAKSRRR